MCWGLLGAASQPPGAFSAEPLVFDPHPPGRTPGDEFREAMGECSFFGFGTSVINVNISHDFTAVHHVCALSGSFFPDLGWLQEWKPRCTSALCCPSLHLLSFLIHPWVGWPGLA